MFSLAGVEQCLVATAVILHELDDLGQMI